MQYRCLDDIGNMWEVTIEEKIGRETGIYWNDKTLWADAVPDPCATSKRIYTYCLDDISNEKLIELFSCITRVDEYLDHTTESKIIEDLATEFVGGASGIAGALVTIAKYGGKLHPRLTGQHKPFLKNIYLYQMASDTCTCHGFGAGDALFACVGSRPTWVHFE